MKPVLMFLAVFSSLPNISSTQKVCDDGDIRLENGYTPNEGRVEVCFNEVWGTVCDDGWDDGNAAVVCRQLGYTVEGASFLSGTEFGRGTGDIFFDETNCEGTEAKLVNCTHTRDHDCFHSEDVSVRCRYNGEATLVLNREIYQNNSIIDIEDIEGSAILGSLLCLTNRFPCCSTPQDGSWYGPDSLALGSFFQSRLTSLQVVILLQSNSANDGGLFRCEVLDKANVAQTLYIGIYTSGNGVPMITDVRYERSSQTVICTSTGGPATSVTWSRDNATLVVDGTTYQQSQTVTDTSTATYQNRLRLSSETYGVYSCTVSNSAGTTSSQVRVSVCTDGEAATQSPNIISALCYNGEWYNVTRTNSVTNPGTTIPVSDSEIEQADSEGGARGKEVVLGSLLGVALLVTVCVVTGACIWTAVLSIRKRRERSNTLPMELINSYSTTGEHLVSNDIYGAPDANTMSPNMAYDSSTQFEYDRDEVNYEEIREGAVHDTNYELIDNVLEAAADSHTEGNHYDVDPGEPKGREGNGGEQHVAVGLSVSRGGDHGCDTGPMVRREGEQDQVEYQTPKLTSPLDRVEYQVPMSTGPMVRREEKEDHMEYQVPMSVRSKSSVDGYSHLEFM